MAAVVSGRSPGPGPGTGVRPLTGLSTDGATREIMFNGAGAAAPFDLPDPEQGHVRQVDGAGMRPPSGAGPGQAIHRFHCSPLAW